MAKRGSRHRPRRGRAPARGKTRRRKQARDRRQAVNPKDRLPGHLFSLGELHEAKGARYLPALFAAIPEDQIVAALPPGRQFKRGRGRPPYPRRAMLRALVVRFAYRLDSYRELQTRLQQDLLLKYECGFSLSQSTPDHTTLEKFAQFLGDHVAALHGAHGTLVDVLGEHLPGLGERTSWDSSYLALHRPQSAPAPEGQGSGSPAPGDEPGARAEGAPAAQGAGQPAPGSDDSAPCPSEAAAQSTPRRGRKQPRRSGRARSKQGSGRQGTFWRGRGRPSQPAPDSAGAPDWGHKQYETVTDKRVNLSDGRTVDGIEVKRQSLWIYGGKYHAIVDNRWHLPLRTHTTPASQADCPMIVPMYRHMTQAHRWMECQYAMVDKAGDSEHVHQAFAEELGLVGIIPLREIPNRQAPAEPTHEFAKTVYDRERVTHMLDPRSGEYVEFEPWGYDEARRAVKYVCPCRRLRRSGELAEDASCPFMGASCQARHGRWPFSFWAPLKLNYRYYCAVPRESQRWAELYKERTTAERVNSVVKGPLGLGDRRLRSLATAACEVALASVFLCARALVAAQWGAWDQVGSAVSPLSPRAGYRAAG